MKVEFYRLQCIIWYCAFNFLLFSTSAFCVGKEGDLYTEEEFETIIKGNSHYSEFPITQAAINERDYRVCNSPEEFTSENRKKLQEGLDFSCQCLVGEIADDSSTSSSEEDLAIGHSSAATVLPKELDMLLKSDMASDQTDERAEQSLLAEDEPVSLGGALLYHTSYSIAATAKDKLGGNEDRAFYEMRCIKTCTEVSYPVLISIVIDGHSYDRGKGGLSTKDILENRIGDYIRREFFEIFEQEFKRFVFDVNDSSSVQKSAVVAPVNLSRKITGNSLYDQQGATLNVAVVLPVEQGKLRLFVANVGDSLCFVFNKYGFTNRYLSLNLIHADPPISEEVKDLMTHVWLLHKPHNQPSLEYREQNLEPFGGRILYYDGTLRTFCAFAVGDAITRPPAMYCSIGDKQNTPAMSPHPDVVAIDLEEGDFIIQVTDAIEPADWMKQIKAILSTDNQVPLSKLVVRLAKSGCGNDDSTVALTYVHSLKEPAHKQGSYSSPSSPQG